MKFGCESKFSWFIKWGKLWNGASVLCLPNCCVICWNISFTTWWAFRLESSLLLCWTRCAELITAICEKISLIHNSIPIFQQSPSIAEQIGRPTDGSQTVTLPFQRERLDLHTNRSCITTLSAAVATMACSCWNGWSGIWRRSTHSERLAWAHTIQHSHKCSFPFAHLKRNEQTVEVCTQQDIYTAYNEKSRNKKNYL